MVRYCSNSRRRHYRKMKKVDPTLTPTLTLILTLTSTHRTRTLIPWILPFHSLACSPLQVTTVLGSTVLYCDKSSYTVYSLYSDHATPHTSPRCLATHDATTETYYYGYHLVLHHADRHRNRYSCSTHVLPEPLTLIYDPEFRSPQVMIMTHKQ